MSTSAAQVSRLLTLVPYLRRVGEVSLAETAAIFGVTQQQLVKDLNALWFCGLPGGLTDDLIDVDMDGLEAGRIRLSNADFLPQPMRFTPDEALSLIVALQAVGELADEGVAKAVETAVAKLRNAQATAGLAPCEPGATEMAEVVVVSETGTVEIRQLLMAAMKTRKRVVLTYDGAVGSVPRTNTVEPVRIETVDGYAYLQAWSLDRDAWRTYRLDRLVEVQPTNESAIDRGEPEPFTSGWLDKLSDAVLVTLELAEAARWITEYYPVQASRLTKRGLEVDLLVADPVWLRTLLLRLGGQVLRITPPEAAQAAAEAATEALVAYDWQNGCGTMIEEATRSDD